MSVIGIDFDGTLALDAGFVAGDIVAQPDPRMVRVIRKLHEAGHMLCAWTCRADYVAEAWLERHGLRDLFTHINKSLIGINNCHRFDSVILSGAKNLYNNFGDPSLSLRES